MKPLQSNRSLTRTSMKQSEGEGPSEGRLKKTIIILCADHNIIIDLPLCMFLIGKSC